MGGDRSRQGPSSPDRRPPAGTGGRTASQERRSASPQRLAAAEVCRLLAAARGCRDRALVGLLAGSGLAVDQVAALRVRDLSLSRSRVHAPAAGGAPAGWRAIDEATLPWLADQVRGMYPHGYVFPGRRGGRLGRRAVRRIVARLGKRAGIAGRVTPERLR